MTFTVLVLNDGRNDYLEQTLISFASQVVFPTRPYFVLVDDMPEGRDVRFLEATVERFGIDRLVLNDSNLGLGSSVARGWRDVPGQTDFIFHLQNDFVFPAPIDVQRIVTVLDDPTICNVTLLRQPWYPDERIAGGLMETQPGAFEEEIVRGAKVCTHRLYFGFNPGLYRRAFIRPEIADRMPPQAWLERELAIALIAEDSSRRFAILGGRHDPAAVLHIGTRRVGQSPDHDGSFIDSELKRITTILASPQRRDSPQASRARSVGVKSSVTGPVVLLYHRIAALAPDPAHLCVSPEDFREHMRYVAEQYDVLPLDDLVRRVRAGDAMDRAVAITFDDGYLDALTASDILKTGGLPASFFLNTNGGIETFHDTLTRLFIGDTVLPDEVRVDAPTGSCLVLSCRTTEDRARAFRRASEIAWTLSYSQRCRLLRSIADQANAPLAPRPSHRTLIAHEVRELASRPGHSIGAHSANHLWLPSQPGSERVRELISNREYLVALTRQPVNAVAYPYGGHDDETIDVAAAIGFDYGVIASPGRLEAAMDIWRIPRLEVKAGGVERLKTLLNTIPA